MISKYFNRIRAFRELLIQKNIECGIITNSDNVFYLSGFTGGDDLCLIITNKELYGLTDFRYKDQIAEECPDYEPFISKKGRIEALAEILQRIGVKNVGVEDKTLSNYDFNNMQKSFRLNVLGSISDEIESIRIVKEPEEIESISQACMIADKAYEHAIKYIKPGVSEIDIACEIEYFMRKMRAKRPSFDTIVASGPRGAMPHGTASERIIQNGEAITMDFGAFYKGYCSDLTRTVFLGEPSSELVKIYYVVKEAQFMALNNYKSGITGAELDKIARNYIEDSGYGDKFGHGLGHGVGVAIHEAPRISTAGNIELKDGMVFSIEPGIYIVGLGGVRIEDLVTPLNGKLKLLSIASKDLTVL